MLESHAQNLEDVILWRALSDVRIGTYVDIGAQHPTIDSVSLGFFKLGWRGLHVEPNPEFADMLRVARPDEIIVEAAVGSRRGTQQFFRIPGTGLSTCVSQLATAHAANGFSVEEITVRSVTLADIFSKLPDRAIHWLKIDVEGMEGAVLEGWGPASVLPWIVVVEAIVPGSEKKSHEEWEYHLLSRGYRVAYFDGLNRFYVSRSQEHLLSHFGPGPNAFDQFQISANSGAPFCRNWRGEIELRMKTSEQLTGLLKEAEHRLIESLGQQEARRVRVVDLQRRLKLGIAAARKQIAWGHATERRLHDALDDVNEQLQATTDKLSATARENERLAERLRQTEATIHELQGRVHALWHAADCALGALATVHASLAWRLTAPLRMMGRAGEAAGWFRGTQSVWIAAAVRFLGRRSWLRSFVRWSVRRMPALKERLRHIQMMYGTGPVNCSDCPRARAVSDSTVPTERGMTPRARELHRQITLAAMRLRNPRLSTDL